MLKVVEWLVFAVVVCVFFVSFSPLLPFKNMPKTYVVVTGSMIPTIMPGSISVVWPIASEKLQPKDIIAFKSPENAKNTILHRIDSIKSTNPLVFKTKGDNNNAPDNWEVPAPDVVGKYIISVPFFGHAAAFMKKPLGFGLMVVAPAFIFILFQLVNIKKAINEEVDRRVKKVTEKVEKSEKPEKPIKRDKSDKTNKPVTQIIRSILVLMSIISFSSLVCTREILASFSDTVEINNLSISVKDFVPPPVPTLDSPANNALLNTTGLVMRWNAVKDYEDMNSVYYYYESARNPNFNPTAYKSGKLTNNYIPAGGTSDSDYWWHVKACDSIGNCSDWSDPWKVTIDNIAPVVNINDVDNNEVFRKDVKIFGSVTDLHPDHYWFVVQDSDGDTVAGPGTVNESSFFTNHELITWDTTEVDDGEYKLKLNAQDGADNKSSTTSRIIYVENDVDVKVLTPVAGAKYKLGDTVPVTWKINSYNAPGDLYSTIWISTTEIPNYTKRISEKLKYDRSNDNSFDWVIPTDDDDFKTKFMKIKIVVRDEFGNEFSGVSEFFDPVEEEKDKKQEQSKEQKQEIGKDKEDEKSEKDEKPLVAEKPAEVTSSDNTNNENSELVE